MQGRLHNQDITIMDEFYGTISKISGVGHHSKSAARGRYRGRQSSNIFKMIKLSYNANQILPWRVRSTKINDMNSIRRFLLEIKVKNKRSVTFCTGVKFSSWSNFNENGLKLIRLWCRFRKCIVSYTLDVPILVKVGSKFNDHWPYIGIDLWPLDLHTCWLCRYAKIIPLQNHLGDPISLSQLFLWKSNQFETLTPVQIKGQYLPTRCLSCSIDCLLTQRHQNTFHFWGKNIAIAKLKNKYISIYCDPNLNPLMETGYRWLTWTFYNLVIQFLSSFTILSTCYKKESWNMGSIFQTMKTMCNVTMSLYM